MHSSLRVSMIQTSVIWEDRDANLQHVEELLHQVRNDADIVVLPETFSTGFSMNVEKVADTMDGITVSTIKRWAASYNMAIVGSFIAKEDGRFYNRAFFITPEGEEHYYDKRHLFRRGGEDKYFTAGDKRLIVHFRDWNICLMVCYDLRFPVWSRNINNEYDLLIFVANWPYERQYAWTALLRARAVENMAFVCGVNRTGCDGYGNLYDGHSLFIKPNGKEQVTVCKRAEVVRNYIAGIYEVYKVRDSLSAWKDADRFTIDL